MRISSIHGKTSVLHFRFHEEGRLRVIHEVKSWKFKECFIAGDEPDEVEYITDFDMSDDYISLTYRQFEIIKVSPTIYKTSFDFFCQIKGIFYR
jgi:hypothetical protein